MILSVLACLPLTGFIYGFMICSDCGTGIESVFGRTFVGAIYSFFTVLSLGKPWTGGGVITNTNLRPYVLLTFIVLFIISFLLMEVKRRKAETKNLD